MKYIDPKKICFKETVNGRIYEMREGGALWRKTFHYFQLHKEEFMDHYHKRSNAETVFAMMKRKFGHKLYSKSEVGQVNEILCKALAHNICVLIQEYYEIDIKLNFKECEKLKVAK